MRKLLVMGAALTWVLAAGSAQAGHYEGWTDDEKMEHVQREPAPPPCAQPVYQERVTRVMTDVGYPSGADSYDDLQSHPFRLLAYIIHPIGYSLEWLVTRPFHELVAQPDLEPVFGHGPHGYYAGSPLGAAEAMNSERAYDTRY